MSEEKKNKGGRPTKYKEEYCEKVIQVMKNGASKVEFCAEIGVAYNTFLSWQEENPEFMTSVKTAEMMCQAWWEKKGREATFNSEGFNATSYIFNMKNRFKDDWRDKHEVDTSHSGSIEVKQISDDKLKEELRRLGYGRETNQLAGKSIDG